MPEENVTRDHAGDGSDAGGGLLDLTGLDLTDLDAADPTALGAALRRMLDARSQDTSQDVVAGFQD
ncbi:FXSXX-COOH protein [Thermopolyspora flexuosa]|jgi:FXSXX-COOH protein|uniref:FXSXX-COOH protein n=1 Tax=Thermopolyspora flexuosa TaxID=103836 RepID=A0A543J3Y2_9ACTN|nr:FxSxx-COOH cyclophane-containing RiPP peptide [Thermopolyspora flexuosa]TQM77534.1 FXSXX-COOH protein [Thermopolyspora flexuosa]